MGDLTPLPITPFVPGIVEAVRGTGAAVVVAPPGAGKTTRVPPALADDGPVVVLQPRRVAARALARRIALEQEFTLGDEVGWQVRFERRFSPRTRLLVATEGVLTARLQSDPLLSGFRTVVLDEFHERSVHADLAIALVREARRARPDLRVVVMSATLDPGPVAAYLGACATIEIPGRPHPVVIEHAPGLELVEAVRRELAQSKGHLLVFLPGAPEIRRAEGDLRRALGARGDLTILPLHGSLSADEQDAALAPSDRRKIILATNLAETSITVEGVTAVIDSGLHKLVRRDPATGLDRLVTERIPRDSAEQRSGRAGRTAPGRCLRLWDPRDELRPRREPEIGRVDLAGPLLDLMAWGADPRSFEWFEPPPADAIDEALALLAQLGATEEERIAPLGRQLRELPLHPRLARLLLADGASPRAAAACAALAEGWRPAGELATSESDLLVVADRLREGPESLLQAARELERIGRGASSRLDASEETFLRAVFDAFPDRVAKRREPGSPKLILASGHGASLDRASGLREGTFLVAVDLVAGRRGPGSEARVRLASRIDEAWLETTSRTTEHSIDPASGTVRAVERELHGAIVRRERTVEPDPGRAGPLLAEAWLARGPDERSAALVRRLAFAGFEIDLERLVRDAFSGRTRPIEIDLTALLPHDVNRELNRLAPDTLAVPSGRRVRLDYRADGSVVASVKLQELFGLGETPRLGARGEPVTFELLAPNGRPVQTTRDLRSFWERTYPEVRRELRGRYPKHPWPDDPWSARPTARTRGRG